MQEKVPKVIYPGKKDLDKLHFCIKNDFRKSFFEKYLHYSKFFYIFEAGFGKTDKISVK